MRVTCPPHARAQPHFDRSSQRTNTFRLLLHVSDLIFTQRNAMPQTKKTSRTDGGAPAKTRGRPRLPLYDESTDSNSESNAEITMYRRTNKRKAPSSARQMSTSTQPTPSTSTMEPCGQNDAMIAMQAAMAAQLQDMREMKDEIFAQMEELRNPEKRRRVEEENIAPNDNPPVLVSAHLQPAVATYGPGTPMPTLMPMRPVPAPRSARTHCGPDRRLQTPAGPQYAFTYPSVAATAQQAVIPSTTAVHQPAQPTAVNDLMTAACTGNVIKKGNHPLLPHLFVIRGSKREKIAVGDATMPEYFAALFKMVKSDEVPASWSEHIYEHMHNIAVMACEWDWHTCRLWSEKVFDMIDDGRLPHAWADHYAVKDIQRDAYAVGNRVTQQKRANNNTRNTQASSTTGYNNSHATSSGSHDSRQDFSRETDGKPCNPWNWGNDCGHSASHGDGQERKAHVCAWCANNYRRANVHKEKDCLNKKRYLDKKNTQATDTKEQPSQGFC